jgi:hypothetical protein
MQSSKTARHQVSEFYRQQSNMPQSHQVNTKTRQQDYKQQIRQANIMEILKGNNPSSKDAI